VLVTARIATLMVLYRSNGEPQAKARKYGPWLFEDTFSFKDPLWTAGVCTICQSYVPVVAYLR
jgi:hypothetical protein